jgi:peptidoglycan lytic transglycosylase G
MDGLMRIAGSMRAVPWIGLAVALVAAGGAGATYFWHSFERPLTMSAARVEVRIANGASARSIAHAVRAAGVELNELEFIAAARATGATRSLRAGRYAIDSGMSMRSLVDMIQRGDVLRERLTILEGATFRDLRTQFDSTPELQHQTARLSDAELLRAIGAGEKNPEGLFAPDTYLFDPGSSDLELYRRAYRMQAERVEQAWDARAPDLPYRNAYEALIMASLVEKETGQPDERRRVAGVFVNRQRRGMPLQTDPSVIYGLGDRFDGRLHRRDLGADTPYNTYLRAGLPPTPIALPGRAAIEAALNPEATRDLYFVARGDGTSEFSSTLAEHERAVDRFQRSSASAGAPAPRRSSAN